MKKLYKLYFRVLRHTGLQDQCFQALRDARDSVKTNAFNKALSCLIDRTYSDEECVSKKIAFHKLRRSYESN